PEDTPEPQPQPDQEQQPQPEAEPQPQPESQTAPQPETVPTVDGGSCETCGDVKQVRQGLCLDCRRLEQQTPQEPQQHAEPAAA
ncbi:hypothetical protein NUG22_39125, partial [Saccharothrix longispora]|nr:hypothetical protein [Saccharothrix longispora]